MGCDFCNLQNAPRFALLVLLLTAVIFASQTLVSCTWAPGTAQREGNEYSASSDLSCPCKSVSLLFAVSLSWQAKDGPGAFQYLYYADLDGISLKQT